MRTRILTVIALSTIAFGGCMVEGFDEEFEAESVEPLMSEVIGEVPDDYAMEDMDEEGLILSPTRQQDDELPVVAERTEVEEDAEIDDFVAEEDPQNACWVTLNYCVDPAWGNPRCSATGCGYDQAKQYCMDLICDYCGCQLPYTICHSHLPYCNYYD